MADLDAAIRQAVAEAHTQRRDGDELMAVALLAVLDLHADDELGFCRECSDEFPAASPCPTKLAIVSALGIGAAGGSDDDVTPEQFDAMLDAGEPVEIVTTAPRIDENEPHDWISSGQAILAAWRAAGSPPRVALAFGPGGEPAPYLYGPQKRGGVFVEATPEQAAAWREWTGKRARLRAAAKRESP